MESQNQESGIRAKNGWTLLIPLVGMVLGIEVTVFLKIREEQYANLIVNLFFLAATGILFRILDYSKKDVGLEIIPGKVNAHVFLSLAAFSIYLLFYIFVIRISGLRPVDAGMIWGLITFAVVVLAEEVYFRGILYRFLERRFSGITALIGSSVIFGLFHATQGVRGIVSRAVSGWLWGSVRYSTGMIFLLIIPVHFAYNSIWLLFEGNWSNPPAWAPYGLPAVEFLIGLAIVLFTNKRPRQRS